MLTQESRAELARNDTLIHRAEGAALNRLSNYYGFERPEIVSTNYWQEALRSAVYGARGTLGILQDFLENMFGEFIDYSTYDMEVLSQSSLRYTGNQAICNLETRYVRINGTRYYTTHSDGDILYLSPVRTTYWEAANFSSLVGQTVSVAVFPYLLEEYGGVVRLVMDAGLFAIPPTYLREFGEARQNEPFGGHIMDFFSSSADEAYGDQAVGPYPAYLVVEEFFGSFFPVILNVLAAGIPLRVFSRIWCENESSIYGSLTTYLRYGSVDPNAIAAVPART